MPSPKLFFAHHQLPASQTRDSTHLVLEGRGEGGGGSTLLGRGEGGGAGNEGGEGSKLEHGCAIIGHKVSAIDIVLEPPPCCAMALVSWRENLEQMAQFKLRFWHCVLPSGSTSRLFLRF